MRSTLVRSLVLAIVIGAAALLVVTTRGGGESRVSKGATQPVAGIPRLVDLGASKCIPCKAMAPILVQLREDYRGRLDVQFIDVWENEGAGSAYGIRMIPTQIFYAADGRELARHEGFIDRAQILAKWKALGIEL